MSEEIMGHWHLMKERCQYCHKVADRLLVVMSGPTTGKFCSRFCYENARQTMEAYEKQKANEVRSK